LCAIPLRIQRAREHDDSFQHRRVITVARVRTFCFFSAIVLASTIVSAQSLKTLDEAPLDRVVTYPHDALVELFREAQADYITTTRLLEGGVFNVNIRHVQNVTPENFRMLVHEDTIDVWVVQEGSGTLLTGGRTEDGRHVGGEERFIEVGDLVFIPAGIPHGMKESSAITWLNIRFPEHRN
jgi:mannose-6-phosphate isomerase-like protein (cupin superfamily)